MRDEERVIKKMPEDLDERSKEDRKSGGKAPPKPDFPRTDPSGFKKQERQDRALRRNRIDFDSEAQQGARKTLQRDLKSERDGEANTLLPRRGAGREQVQPITGHKA